ncbi:catabolic L-serine/threonine dehydratase [Thecaphora frezii]
MQSNRIDWIRLDSIRWLIGGAAWPRWPNGVMSRAVQQRWRRLMLGLAYLTTTPLTTAPFPFPTFQRHSQSPTMSAPPPAPLHHLTPLAFSPSLSLSTGHRIFLKLDCLQPSGSFKLRGLGAASQRAYLLYRSATHLVCSSGGNAGLAVAYSASNLGVGCTIFVPNTTEVAVVQKLRSYGAEVEVVGEVWNDADQEARRFAEKKQGRVYLHPFEGDELIQGHATLMQEVETQMPDGQTVDAVICAVGGGGLMAGILHHLSSSQAQTRLLTLQCYGADSFSQSLLLPPSSSSLPVTLHRITSAATSMATKTCSATHLASARQFGLVTPVRVDDDLAAEAVWRFYKDTGYLVELSCGAALAPVFFPERILNKALGQEAKEKNVVVVVCGGSKVDEEMVREYERRTSEREKRGRADVDGVEV